MFVFTRRTTAVALMLLWMTLLCIAPCGHAWTTVTTTSSSSSDAATSITRSLHTITVYRERTWSSLSAAPTMAAAVSTATKSVATPTTSSAQRKPVLDGAEINARTAKQLDKMRAQDEQSPVLAPEDLDIVFEDDHIVVVHKPAGVLSVTGRQTKHLVSLADAVYARTTDTDLADANRMVVHRLGRDTSGLMVLAKTLDAVRGLNALFRTRAVHRTYEALVCGRVVDSVDAAKPQRKRASRSGWIDLPLMRDYERPPFVRVSTDEHQEALVPLDPSVVGKALLEAPKESLTHYTVMDNHSNDNGETMGGQPVTRLSLHSLSGRTHQLNCHLAAWGHPIVGDTVYGLDGDALPQGGLTDDEASYLLPSSQRRNTKPMNRRATEEEQRGANAAAEQLCCHAGSLRFRHPVTKQEMEWTVEAPF